MPNTPFPATAEGLSTRKATLSAIMRRAWEIFRETYRYPDVPFRSIGRACFAWALKKAWHQAKEMIRKAALSVVQKRTRAAAIKNELAVLPFKSLRYDILPMQRRLEAELHALAV